MENIKDYYAISLCTQCKLPNNDDFFLVQVSQMVELSTSEGSTYLPCSSYTFTGDTKEEAIIKANNFIENVDEYKKKGLL